MAKLISLLFHPLWIPTFLFAIVYHYAPSVMTPQELNPRIILVIFTLTGIIPIITLVFMRLPYFLMVARLWVDQLANGGHNTKTLMSLRPKIEMVNRQSIIHSFGMEDRAERVIPFFVITAFYISVCVMMGNKMGWDSFFVIAMSTIAGISLLVSVITLFWKISVHSVSVNSMVGFLMAAMVSKVEPELLYPLLGSILAAGAVMSARLYLDAHSPAQVGWGCLLGFAISFTATWIYL